MNYLEYLGDGNKLDWLKQPINVNKNPVVSDWLIALIQYLKQREHDNEEIPIESNKNTSNSSNDSRNSGVVDNNALTDDNSSHTFGHVRININNKRKS